MGFDVNRFSGGNVDEELLCPICSGVMESPVQVTFIKTFVKSLILKAAQKLVLH